MNTAQNLRIGTWALGALVTLLAVVAWSTNLPETLTLYRFFPLLGLLAFSLMWTHYVSGAARTYLKQESGTLRTYFRITSGVVLALILLHPGIFYLQLFLDGLGFPPGSYMQVYTELAQRTAILIATISLLIFLSFESYRKFKNRSWWKYIEYANIAAMFGIFYHALTIGSDLMNGWFKIVWYLYGIILLIAIIYSALQKKKKLT